MFTEDIGNIRWSTYNMIAALRTLQSWLKKAPDYVYPADAFMKIEDEL